MKYKNHVRKTQLVWIFCIQNFLDTPRALEVCIHIRVISNSKIEIKVKRFYQFTNKCYRILCLRHWHFWFVYSLSYLQLVTIRTNVSRLLTKMTHPNRLTMHLVLRKGRLLKGRLLYIWLSLWPFCIYWNPNVFFVNVVLIS